MIVAHVSNDGLARLNRVLLEQARRAEGAGDLLKSLLALCQRAGVVAEQLQRKGRTDG